MGEAASRAAEAAVSKARAIAGHVRCQPLPDRAADLTLAGAPAPAHRA